MPQPNGSVPPGSWSRFRAALDRLLAGDAPADPLYLSNRTFFQKARIWILIAVPCGLVVGIFFIVNWWMRAEAPRPPEPTKAELAARLLPNIDQIRIPNDQEIEVSEAQVIRGATVMLKGTLRNKSSRAFRVVHVTFNLTDGDGSGVGAVVAKVENLAAGASAKFEVPLPQQTAVTALVRDIQTQ